MAATPTQTSAGVTPMTPTMPMTTMKTNDDLGGNGSHMSRSERA